MPASSAPSTAPANTTLPSQGQPTYGPPPEGVYVYDTTGFEETDALGGARHDYPRQTTLTVRHVDCGWTQRWQPLEERWDEMRLCPGDRGRMLLQLTTFHEFFRQTQQQDTTCGQDSVFLPTPPEPGASTQVTCTGSFGTVAMSTHVLGREAVPVAGSGLDAVRIRYDVQFSGSNRGAGTFEEWIDERGVVLRRTWDMDIETDSPFGTVRYRESYEIVLAAAEPQT